MAGRMKNMKKSILFLMIAVALVVQAAGQEPKVKVLKDGHFRVIYYTEGPFAVSPKDVNGNGTPDQVEDMLTQTAAAELLFVKLLGFPDPLHSKRLKGVRFIDIRVGGRTNQKDDAASTSRKIFYPKDIPGTPLGAGSFVIYFGHKKNVLGYMSHEYFHLLQYAATHCRTGWFTEGTARWSQSQNIVTDDPRRYKSWGWDKAASPNGWPPSPALKAKLFEMNYGSEAAQLFWNRLAVLCDSDGEIPHGPVFEKLMSMRYSDGSRVIKDTRLVGWRLVRDVFLELGKIDGGARARKDNDAIFRAVEKAVVRHLPRQEAK